MFLRLNFSILFFRQGVPVTPAVLSHLIESVGVNGLFQFAPAVGANLRAAQKDDKLRDKLKALDYIVYAGAEIPEETTTWAMREGIHFLVRHLAGCSSYISSLTLDLVRTPWDPMKLVSHTT